LASSKQRLKPKDLNWRDLAKNGRRALEMCWETSRWYLSALIGTSLAASTFPAALAGLAGYLVTQVEALVVEKSDDLASLVPALGAFAVVMLLSGFMQALRAYCNSMLSAHMDLRITKQLAAHSAELDLAFFQLPENHNIITRGAQYAGHDFLKFVLSMISIGAEVFQFVTLLGVMMWIQPIFTPILALLVLPMLAFRWGLSKMQYKINIAQTSKARLKSYYSVELTRKEAIPVVKIFELAPILLERFEALGRDLIDLDQRLYRRSAIGQAVGTAAFALAFLAAAAWAVQETLGGALALGSLVTYLTCAQRFRTCTTKVTKFAAEMFKNSLFVQNLYALLDATPKIQTEAGLSPGRAQGRIELRNASFHYPGTDDATIRGVDLDIRPGETIALVGPNGAGKTTLAHLIARLYDADSDGGRVLLDGTDVRDLSARYYYDQIAYVGQTPVRFETTAEESLAFGDFKRLKGDRKKIEEIAKKAGVDSIIEKLPSGYDTILGRRFGEQDLSGGEWQRLAVARALAKDAPILILDEPTANLDARSEFELFTALREMTRDKTAIIVSHRFATVRSADRIVVMDEGEIVEIGSHDELMELGGMYSGLYKIQHRALNG
jgi:ATP-binding cassette subfamily B protein